MTLPLEVLWRLKTFGVLPCYSTLEKVSLHPRLHSACWVLFYCSRFGQPAAMEDQTLAPMPDRLQARSSGRGLEFIVSTSTMLSIPVLASRHENVREWLQY